MIDVEKDAGLRLADAATLLLDVAREVAKQNPEYKPGQSNEKETLALATQAMFFADFDLSNFGGVSPVDSERARARWTGICLGLGCVLGSQQSALSAAADFHACVAVIKRTLAHRIVFNISKGGKP